VWAVSANLDLVRSIYADWERGDWSSAWWAHPDIEYVMVDEPGSATHRGLAEMGDAWRAFLNAWVDYRLEPVEYRTLDEERVLVLVRAYGRGKASGVELSELPARSLRVSANLFRIREGRVVRLDAYFNSDRALADLGLTE
jgi:ketosteroid isomerase-like protein